MMILMAILAVVAFFMATTMIALATTTPGNLGAKLWDESTQGSDHTVMPGQPPLIAGGPENVVFAPVGTLVVDEVGQLYQKTTPATLATGWGAIAVTPIVT